jgi:hypothetical protein
MSRLLGTYMFDEIQRCTFYQKLDPRLLKEVGDLEL